MIFLLLYYKHHLPCYPSDTLNGGIDKIDRIPKRREREKKKKNPKEETQLLLFRRNLSFFFFFLTIHRGNRVVMLTYGSSTEVAVRR